MAFSMKEAKRVVQESFSRAQENLEKIAKAQKTADALSDVVPGYKAKELDFGSYQQDNFSVLFIDIRQSTDRAVRLGPKDTFLTFHAFIPGVSYTVESYNGHVLDFMGDGVMAFFGGNGSGMAKSFAGGQAGKCGFTLLQVVDEAINPVLVGAGIEELYCGVGVDHGPVIVTKVGTHSTYDVKAFGNCVNKASKLAASACNTLIVTKKIRDWWPTSSRGTIRFQSTVTKGIPGFKVLKGERG